MSLEFFSLEIGAIVLGVIIGGLLGYGLLRAFLPRYALSRRLARLALKKEGRHRQMRLRTYRSLFTAHPELDSNAMHDGHPLPHSLAQSNRHSEDPSNTKLKTERNGTKQSQRQIQRQLDASQQRHAQNQAEHTTGENGGADDIRYLSEILQAGTRHHQTFYQSPLFLEGIEALFGAYSESHFLEQMMKILAIHEKANRALLFLKQQDKENGVFLKLQRAWLLRLSQWDRASSEHNTQYLTEHSNEQNNHSNEDSSEHAHNPSVKHSNSRFNEHFDEPLVPLSQATLEEFQETAPLLFARTEVYFNHLEPFTTYEKKGANYQFSLFLPLFKSGLQSSPSASEPYSSTPTFSSSPHLSDTPHTRRGQNTPNSMINARHHLNPKHTPNTSNRPNRPNRSNTLQLPTSDGSISNATSEFLGCIKLEKDIPAALQKDSHTYFSQEAVLYAQFTLFMTKCHQCLAQFPGQRTHNFMDHRHPENSHAGFLTEPYMNTLLQYLFHYHFTSIATMNPLRLGIIKFAFADKHKLKLRQTLKTLLGYLHKQLPPAINLILGLGQSTTRFIYVLAVTEAAAQFLTNLFLPLIEKFLEPVFPNKEIAMTFRVTALSPAQFTSLQESAEEERPKEPLDPNSEG